jgi:hypothetical protein
MASGAWRGLGVFIAAVLIGAACSLLALNLHGPPSPSAPFTGIAAGWIGLGMCVISGLIVALIPSGRTGAWVVLAVSAGLSAAVIGKHGWQDLATGLAIVAAAFGAAVIALLFKGKPAPR